MSPAAAGRVHFHGSAGCRGVPAPRRRAEAGGTFFANPEKMSPIRVTKLRGKCNRIQNPEFRMQTFDSQKAPVIPPYCLWVSGLLLESGCRASAGLPRVQRVRQTVGNRLAMGEKASGAWGAPDASPVQELAAAIAAHWAGCAGESAATSQTMEERVAVRRAEYLVCSATPHGDTQVRGFENSDGADVASGKTSPAHGKPSTGAGEAPAFANTVMFTPKPEPWGGAGPAGGRLPEQDRTPSFFRKPVVFSPALNRVC